MLAWALRGIPVALIAAGCSTDAPPVDKAAPSAPDATPAPAAVSFINRVWVVAESEQVAPGALRVFLSDGTLVMASSTGTPALGAWSYSDGQLTIAEEGLKYDVDVLELTPDVFRIRIHSPGDPVVIRFSPAESPPLAGWPPRAGR